VDSGSIVAIDKKDVGTGKFIKAEPTCIGVFRDLRNQKIGANQSSTLDLLESLEKLTKIKQTIVSARDALAM